MFEGALGVEECGGEMLLAKKDVNLYQVQSTEILRAIWFLAESNCDARETFQSKGTACVSSSFVTKRTESAFCGCYLQIRDLSYHGLLRPQMD